MIAYILIGFFYFDAKCQDQRLADSLLLVLENRIIKNDSGKFQILSQIAINSNSPNDIILYSDSALQVAERNNNPRWIALSHLYRGDGFRLRGDLTNAIECYLLSAKYYQNGYDDIGLGSAYVNLGGVYLGQDNFELSRYYYSKAILIFRTQSDSLRLATTLLNKGELFRNFMGWDSAVVHFNESRQIFDRLKHIAGSAYNLGNLGMVYKDQNKLLIAEKNLNDAIRNCKILGDHYPISAYQIALSEIYEKRNEFDLAIAYADSALQLGIQEGLKEQIRDASLQLSKLHKTKGDSEKAYGHLNQYLMYRDSINNEEVIRKMADLRTEYEVGQKQIEVNLLNSQARVQRIILAGVVVVLIIVFILAYVLYKLYKLRNRAIKIAHKRREVISAQRNELAELNETKDKFFSIISHDLRAPVNNFQGVSQLIQLNIESGDTQELKRVSQLMEKSSGELSTLLDNLLDWAMNQQGSIPFKPEPFDLSTLCYSSIEMMENLADSKQLTLKRNIEENVIINADRNSISTIIRNLLSNSIKFTEKGGVISMELRSHEDHVQLKIEDTGIGIAIDKLTQLFTFKGERTRWGTAGEKGVGLGLNLVYEFVEMNHGSIEVESEEGAGTTFVVQLPIQ